MQDIHPADLAKRCNHLMLADTNGPDFMSFNRDFQPFSFSFHFSKKSFCRVPIFVKIVRENALISICTRLRFKNCCATSFAWMLLKSLKSGTKFF
jgi:hypothetical protein